MIAADSSVSRPRSKSPPFTGLPATKEPTAPTSTHPFEVY